MEHSHTKTTQYEENPATLNTYLIGFILSIILTLVPYFLVVNHILTGNMILTSILTLALVQLIVQLVFFLHLGRESKPRWKLVVFISFVGIILTIVIGSVWIMQHLNYNMGPAQLDQLMKSGEGF